MWTGHELVQPHRDLTPPLRARRVTSQLQRADRHGDGRVSKLHAMTDQASALVPPPLLDTSGSVVPVSSEAALRPGFRPSPICLAIARRLSE